MITFENSTVPLIAQTCMQEDRNLPDFQLRKKVELSQNKKFCEVGFSLTKIETEPVRRLKLFGVSTGAYKESKNHQKTTTSDGTVLTTVSRGGCRFITGTTGLYQCGCTNPRECHKSGKGRYAPTPTPRCFSYHDRFLQAGM